MSESNAQEAARLQAAVLMFVADRCNDPHMHRSVSGVSAPEIASEVPELRSAQRAGESEIVLARRITAQLCQMALLEPVRTGELSYVATAAGIQRVREARRSRWQAFKEDLAPDILKGIVAPLVVALLTALVTTLVALYLAGSLAP